MARALRRTDVAIGLAGLVAASTLIHSVLALRFTGLWIMPDEAIYGERALGLWRHGTLSILHGDGAGYSVLYPIVAGLPLSLGKLTSGYDSLKVVQAFVMSLTAIPVYFYGRRLMRPGYALLAAALTLAPCSGSVASPTSWHMKHTYRRAPRKAEWRATTAGSICVRAGRFPGLVSIIMPCCGMLEYTKLSVPSVLRF